MRETMEQHMYSFLHHKVAPLTKPGYQSHYSHSLLPQFGLAKLVIEHACGILKATEVHKLADNDIMVFSQIMHNDIDEDFRKVSHEK